MFTQNIYFYNSTNDIMSSFLVTIRTQFKGYINVSILLTLFPQNITLFEHFIFNNLKHKTVMFSSHDYNII